MIPSGIVTTGWPRIEKRLLHIGIRFDAWQQGLAQVVLGKRKSGKYAATIGGVVLSIPRQVGKTFFVVALLMAMCIEFPGMRVLWTSHHLRTTQNTFRVFQGLAKRKRVAPHITAVRIANGEGEIRFRNGSIIMFGARAMGFGRGMDKVDIEVFDEAQILDSKSLEDMVAATNQAQHVHGALLFFMGTPPRPVDPGEEFSNRREKALSGKWRDGVYVELSADIDADPNDWDQIAKANPSYPYRTPKESIQRLRENLTDDDSWMREGLGVWDPKLIHAVIDPETWAAAADEMSVALDKVTLAIDVSPDRKTASVALAGVNRDGKWHIELDEQRRSVGWVVPWVVARCKRNDIHAVVVDKMSPAFGLVADLKGAGIRATVTDAAAMTTACGALYDGIVEGTTVHTGQDHMAVALGSASKRDLESGWAWSRKNSTSDITPIVAATLALWGAQNSKVKRPTRASDARKVVVLS